MLFINSFCGLAVWFARVYVVCGTILGTPALNLLSLSLTTVLTGHTKYI